jgi:hypothetical protein
MPAFVSWLFAVWWIVSGIRDFTYVRYGAKGSSRYGQKLPLRLSFAAAGILAALGYALASARRTWVMPMLVTFGVVWVAWLLVAKRGWSKE